MGIVLGPKPSRARATNPAESRTRLYRFLEAALAHPGEDGIACFKRHATEASIDAALRRLDPAPDAETGAPAHARAFFAGLRTRRYAEIEADYIRLFSIGATRVPCPPYGSLYTAKDDNARLGEILAIKSAYGENGVAIAPNFDDLPDHLCVELEFLMLLSARESEAQARGESALAERLRAGQAGFLDRFALPLLSGMAAAADRAAADHPYCHLLKCAEAVASRHRETLAGAVASASRAGERM